MKVLGKPYAGKLHVRIDEGEKETRSANEANALYRLFLFSTLLVKDPALYFRLRFYVVLRNSFLDDLRRIPCGKED